MSFGICLDFLVFGLPSATLRTYVLGTQVLCFAVRNYCIRTLCRSLPTWTSLHCVSPVLWGPELRWSWCRMGTQRKEKTTHNDPLYLVDHLRASLLRRAKFRYCFHQPFFFFFLFAYSCASSVQAIGQLPTTVSEESVHLTRELLFSQIEPREKARDRCYSNPLLVP